MENQTENTERKNFSNWYDKNYKKLLIIPAVLLILSISYLFYFYSVNKDFIKKDVSLTGGITITIEPNQEINIDKLNNYLSQKLDNFAVRELSNSFSGKQEAVVIQSPIQNLDSDSSEISNFKSTIEEFLGYELNSENSSTEKTGSKFGESFYKQLVFAIMISFILMALVVFMIFRTLAPSAAVVISAFADIIMTIALVNFLGIKISSAGIMAFLMLIGYSVDTDIMLMDDPVSPFTKKALDLLQKRVFLLRKPEEIGQAILEYDPNNTPKLRDPSFYEKYVFMPNSKQKILQSLYQLMHSHN